ncbi:MAG: rod shape-determining protein MreC [Candidatus Paceibacterota bacterium]
MNTNISNIKIFFISKTELAVENQALKQQLTERDARVANYEAIFNENEKIKEILLRKPDEKKILLAGILGTQNKSIYDSLIIDAGAEQGLHVGDRVFAYGDIPIGTIAEVFTRSATVTLYSTSGQQMSAVISGSDTFIELIGRGRGNFEVVLPRDFNIIEGTLVLLPGLHPYALAEVVTVISDPRDPFKKALLKSPINILELKFVQVEI